MRCDPGTGGDFLPRESRSEIRVDPSIGLSTPSATYPALRGVSHSWAVVVAIAAAIWLVLRADDATARGAASIYGLGLCALFGGSALYHRWRWDSRWRPVLRRVDHSTIFVFIAATYTPVALLVLDGTVRALVLAVVWAGALCGVLFSLAWINAPRALQAVLYVALGWVVVAALPQMLERLDVQPIALIGAGGVLYTLGAVIYSRQRPDPWPQTFGFHEVFHGLVIGAAACQFAAIAGWIVT